MPDATDWISAVSGVSGLLIAFVTLLTVYIAALQFVSKQRVSRHGLSREVLGRWQPKVVTSSFLGLEKKIHTPAVSMENLVRQGWTPNFNFSVGIGDGDLESQRRVLAKASWVNFMEALSISPDDRELVEMRYEGDLVNGSLPMRWRGPDLVAVCAMLGFDSREGDPEDYAMAFNLPMQWVGPLGWLQFRAGFESCVVEFRQRATWLDELDAKFHLFYAKLPQRTPSFLEKASYSMGGMYVEMDGKFKMVYIGAPDNMIPPKSADGVEDAPQVPAVIDYCPSRLSQKIHRDLIWSRGLEQRVCIDYAKTIVPNIDDIDRGKYPYSLGGMHMGLDAMKLCKDALLRLKPDGFYFTPSASVCQNLFDIYEHVYNTFQNAPVRVLPKIEKLAMGFEELYWACELCNTWSSQQMATLSVSDMGILSKASLSIQKFVKPDLVWLLLVSPDLFTAIASRLQNISKNDLPPFLARLNAVHIKDEILSFAVTTGSDTDAKVLSDAAPLCADGEYTGAQVVAAFADVCLTFYWISKKWITGVDQYTASIPLSVMMF